MNIEPSEPSRTPNSWATVVLATALIVASLAGIGLGLYELGSVTAAWRENARAALPFLAHGALSLASGIALGFTHRRAVLFLVLLLISRGIWEYSAQWGWAELGRSSIEGLSLLYALYLKYNGRLGSVGPNNSFKPKPLRGSA